MLKLNNIEVAYLNVIRVLHGVSLKVDDGIIVALLGANGAGKSTTLKAISGLLKIEEGWSPTAISSGTACGSIRKTPKKSAKWASFRHWKAGMSSDT